MTITVRLLKLVATSLSTRFARGWEGFPERARPIHTPPHSFLDPTIKDPTKKYAREVAYLTLDPNATLEELGRQTLQQQTTLYPHNDKVPTFDLTLPPSWFQSSVSPRSRQKMMQKYEENRRVTSNQGKNHPTMATPLLVPRSLNTWRTVKRSFLKSIQQLQTQSMYEPILRLNQTTPRKSSARKTRSLHGCVMNT